MIVEWWLPGAGRLDEWGDFGQMLQSFNYTEWMCSKYLMHSMVAIVNNTVLYAWNLLRK